MTEQTKPADADRLADAWVHRWLTVTDPYDVSQLPGGPSPDACEHAWFPLVRSTEAPYPYYCYRGCGSHMPRGFKPDDAALARARAYYPTYNDALGRYVEASRA